MPVEVAQVFVSSTWLDLQPERQAVEAALHRLHETKFVGMEYFGSRDETTRQTSLDEVDRSRVYVGIIAGRYGSGITEDEYRRARELNLPCFVYFKRDSDIRAECRDSDSEKAAKLIAFRQDLQRNHIVSEFTSPDDLATRVTTDLHNWLVKEYLTPRLADAAQGRMARAQARELLTAIKDKSGLDEGLLAAARKVVIFPLLVSLAVAAVALISATALGAYVYFNRNDRVYRVRATVVNERSVPVDNERLAPADQVKVWSSAGGEPKKVAGGWQFDIPAATRPLDGKVTFYAEQATAFLEGRADLRLDEDFNPTITIRLVHDTSAEVRGQVTDGKGRAVSGARVFVVGYESEAIITKEGGNFKLSAHAAVNQLVLVVAEKPGIGVGRLHHPAGDTPVPLVLHR
jgi:hypothetical protein